jgi:pterin-4a-carbinolamine dehydratase
MKGKNLLKEYVNSFNSQKNFLETVPIEAKEPVLPIIPQEKWSSVAGALTKKFDFRTIEQRNYFLTEILCFEAEREQYASYVIRENNIIVSVITKHINATTERDKEFARMCDQLYKCAIYI